MTQPTADDAIKLAQDAWLLRAKIIASPSLTANQIAKRVVKIRKMLEDAVAICQANDAHKEHSFTLAKLAQVLRYTEGTDRTLELLEQAAAAGQRANSGLHEGHALRHIGDILRHRQEFDLAKSYYERAITCLEADSATDTLSRGNAYRPMAILLAELHDSTAAIAYWKRARACYLETGIQDGVDECDANLKALLRKVER